MAYMITHSLLSSWLHSMSDNPYADATQEDSSKQDFLRVLFREPTPKTEAMQNGITGGADMDLWFFREPA